MFNSLLWLEDSKHMEIEADVIKDLNLSRFYKELIQLDEDNSHVLNRLCVDDETIEYRHDIVEDFLNDPRLPEELEKGLEDFSELAVKFKQTTDYTKNLYYLIDLVIIVETSINCLEKINETLNYYTYKSKGLKDLSHMVDTQIKSEDYITMKKDLKQIRYAFSKIKSAEIAINLNTGMRPVEAQVIDLMDHPCIYPSAFRQLASTFKEDGEFLGTRLNHYAPVFKINDLHFDLIDELQFGLREYRPDLDAFISKYQKIDPTPFMELLKEVMFYRSSVKLLSQVKEAGLPLCIPEISPKTDKSCHVKGLYNIHLFESLAPEEIVLNDVSIDNHIYLLTGANSGGKTTFTQAFGQLQILTQLGLPVPAKEARVSLVSGIFTHFPVIEAETVALGRLGKECYDFSRLFKSADPYGLILMNESFASTSHLESLQIASEVVKAAREKGVRTVFNTHLHELLETVEPLNETDGLEIISLISGSGDDISSYLISEGRPLGLSHAMEIAQRYGVTYKQLQKRLEVQNG